MTLPLQTIIDTHEALGDWRFTAQEANQVIAGVGESLMGAILLAAMTGMFYKVVSKNPGEESSNPKQQRNPTEFLPLIPVSSEYSGAAGLEEMCTRCGLPPYLLKRRALPYAWELSRGDLWLWRDVSWRVGKVCWYCRTELHELRIWGEIQTRKWEVRWGLLQKIDSMTDKDFEDWVEKLDENLEIARSGEGLLSEWAYKKGGWHRRLKETTLRRIGELRTTLLSRIWDMRKYRHYRSEAYRQCDRHLLSYYLEEREELFHLPDWWNVE